MLLSTLLDVALEQIISYFGTDLENEFEQLFHTLIFGRHCLTLELIQSMVPHNFHDIHFGINRLQLSHKRSLRILNDRLKPPGLCLHLLPHHP